jgi:hypothetical protein
MKPRRYIDLLCARERFPGSPPALLPAGRPGSETPHDPRVSGSSPGSSGRTGRRRSQRPPEGPKRTKPAIDVHSNRVHRFTISRVHRFTDRGLLGYGVRVFRLRFLFVSRIGSGGSGGGPDFPPRTGGPDGSSRCRDREVRAWVGADGSPGSRRPDRGEQNEGQTPSCAFLQGPGLSPHAWG